MGGEASLGGLTGGIGTAMTSRIARAPATQFNIAKSIQGLGKVVKPIASRAGLIPVVSK